MIAYYRAWQTRVNQHITESQTQSHRRNLDIQIHNSSRVEIVHHQVGNPTFETQPSAGFLETTLAEATPELYCIQPLQEPMLIDGNSGESSNSTGHKRKRVAAVELPIARDHINLGQMGQKAGAQERSQKKCWKCGNAQCIGRQNRKSCMNACMECGRYDCNGKDSRHPSWACQWHRSTESNQSTDV